MTGFSKVSRNKIISILFSMCLGTLLPADATEQVQIIYANKTEQGDTTLNCPDAIKNNPLKSLEKIHSQTPNLSFINKNDTNSFIHVYNDSSENKKDAKLTEGFNSLDGNSLFVMESTFLTGADKLKIPPNSYVLISHIDSDPLKKNKYGSRFNRLKLNMQNHGGFRGMQVWTWNQRVNHWTLIQVWESKTAYNLAMQTEGMRRIWREIFGDTASPAAASPYCYIKNN